MNIGLVVNILHISLKYAHIDRYFPQFHIKGFLCLLSAFLLHIPQMSVTLILSHHLTTSHLFTKKKGSVRITLQVNIVKWNTVYSASVFLKHYILCNI